MNAPAVVTGAAVGLAVALPAAVVARVALDDGSALVFALFVVVLAGFALGGAVAASRRPDAGLVHGAAAGGAAYAVVLVLGAAARAIEGGELRPLTYLANLVLAGAMGALGGLVAEQRAERARPAGGAAPEKR